MVKISIISDIHIGSTIPEIKIENSDCLVLAGDIANITNDFLYTFLEKISIQFSDKILVYIFGNHEYYNSHSLPFTELSSIFREKTKNIKNLVLLDNSHIDIQNNIRIFGTTLWSYIGANSIGMPIFDEDGVQITSNWVNREYFKSLHLLDKAIVSAKNDKKKLIVASHYCPSFTNTFASKKFIKNHGIFYCSNLDNYLHKNMIDTWIYGHTHFNVDFTTSGGTRLISNQYKGKKYMKNKILDITDDYQL